MFKFNKYYYAVHGNYPNVIISKEKFVAEDSFNYCLRMKTGNLEIVSKSDVFRTFEEAVMEQNKRIQLKGKRINSVPASSTFSINVVEGGK